MALDIKHYNFIDWMKALGMFLIVIGHVVGDPFNLYNQISQPVYTKQLGVAFFVFITGWSLANDSRPRLRVVFNRIFPIYFYGFVFALLISLIFIFTKNDTNPSNYLPFFLGVNVLFNNFPANPTTWYIGTYFHLLVFWYFFMQGRTVTIKHLLLAFLVENIVRSLLITTGNNFIAYMTLPNWLTIFLFGMYFRNRADQKSSSLVLFMLIAGWVLALISWSFIADAISFDQSFPFRKAEGFAMASPLALSLLVSGIYILNTWIFFEIARRLPFQKIISFLSRNTLIIFIAHMPVIYELSPYLYRLIDTVMIKQALLIFLLYFGLAVISEMIQRRVPIKSLRDLSWQFIESFLISRKLG